MNVEQKENFRVREFPCKGSSVIFLFTAMGFKIWHYRLIIWLLNKRGFTVVAYDYPVRVVHQADFEAWKKVDSGIHKDIANRIKQLKNKGAVRFGAYGVSMGTLIANKMTRDFKEITHVILNLTYGDVAANIFHSPLTKRTRKILQEQGIDSETLSKVVTYIDPPKNARGLQGKRVLLYLSRRDKVLKYEISRNTKLAFEEAKLDFEYKEHKYLGHFLAGTKNLYHINKISRFFHS